MVGLGATVCIHFFVSERGIFGGVVCVFFDKLVILRC